MLKALWRAGNGSGVFSYKCASSVIFFGTGLALCVALCAPSGLRKEESLPNRIWVLVSISSLQILEQVDWDSVPGLRVPGMFKNTAPICDSALALGARLVAVISEAQHQGPLLSLMPVWIDLWADLQMNGCRWEKRQEISASFVPVTTTSAIKEHAKTLMKRCWVLSPCCWGKPKKMGAWCLILFHPGSPSK